MYLYPLCPGFGIPYAPFSTVVMMNNAFKQEIHPDNRTTIAKKVDARFMTYDLLIILF
jgi:hypothetical protein